MISPTLLGCWASVSGSRTLQGVVRAIDPERGALIEFAGGRMPPQWVDSAKLDVLPNTHVGGCCIFVYRGLPGSGKSTAAKQLAAAIGGLHIESDDYLCNEDGVYEWTQERRDAAIARVQNEAREALTSGKPLVLAQVFPTHASMQWVRELASELRAPLFIATLRGSYGSIHNVPDDAMASMAARFEAIP